MFNHIELDTSSCELKQVNENGTRYYVTPKGNRYPSVTTVLSEYNRKFIYEWRQRVGEEAANRISSKASGRGTRFHKLCEDYLKNKPVEYKTPLDVESFSKFKPLLHRINNIHLQETKMFSDHLRMAGTVDCIAEFDGKLSVIDFKTASKSKQEDSIENYFMQCAAYAIMFEERFNIPINRSVVMISVDDSEPQIFVKKRDDYVTRLLHYRDLHESK